MKKGILTILMFGVFLIIFSHSSEASGVGLMSESLVVGMNFVPNFEETYYYTLLVYNDKPTDIKLYVTDDSGDGTNTALAQYFTLSQNEFLDIDGRGKPYFTVHVKLPSEIKEPGLHRVHVGAVDAPRGGGGIGARAAIEAIFNINVPFNGKYLKYNFKVPSVNQGNPIITQLDVSNLGTEKIETLYANISILNSEKKVVATGKTRSVTLGSQSSLTLYTNISTIGIVPGDYIANATIYHDGKIDIVANQFEIGELNVIITNQTSEIEAGKIDELNVGIESKWAERIPNIYAEIAIGDYPPIKTLDYSLNGFEAANLKGFFDATSIRAGTYDMTIRLHFGDKVTEKKVKIVVKQRSILELPNLNLSLTNIIFLVIIMIILIINISLFLILTKKKEEHEEEKQP